jgi:hypothetical protein
MRSKAIAIHIIAFSKYAYCRALKLTVLILFVGDVTTLSVSGEYIVGPLLFKPKVAMLKSKEKQRKFNSDI